MAERCFVGCTPGLEQALRDELEGLGVRAEVTSGGCEVSGPEGSVVTLNVRSRLASRVLLRVGEARTPSALAAVPVRALLGAAPGSLSVTTAGRVSPPAEVWRRDAMRAWHIGVSTAAAPSTDEGGLAPGRRQPAGLVRHTSPGAPGRRGRGASPSPPSSADQRAGSREALPPPVGEPASSGTEAFPGVGTPGRSPTGMGPDPLTASTVEAGSGGPIEVSLRLDAQGAQVSVDTSGELLYLRGARQETGKAPLRETLAAGVLRLCGWAPGESLWDVMCGSGTFLLEAAEQAQGLQPGRQRHFAFERFVGASPARLADAKARGPLVPTWIRGSDLNAGALGVARRNARRAGVLEALQLERLDATALTRPDVSPGLVLANLPYGKRVGTRFELASLYARVGRSLRQALRGWRFGFLLQDGAEALGLEVTRTVPVKNGGLSCHVVMGRL
jgi:23S rRNA G2445 N2-methylase RlmL